MPYMEIIHDRIMLEIMRGCTRGCRFCQAGILYRPVRERSLEHLVELAQQLENTTGYEEISLSSLSSGDYTCLAELIRELIRRLDEKHVSISLPSLRLDSVLKDSLEATQKEIFHMMKTTKHYFVSQELGVCTGQRMDCHILR